MMTNERSAGLEKFYAFFDMRGTERLGGLDSSHFRDLTESEKEEAWNFLKKNLGSSVESSSGLYLLNPTKAAELFKDQVHIPIDTNLYPAERSALEENRMLMLHLILSVAPDQEYVDLMNLLGKSEFYYVRSLFAQYLPIENVSRTSLEILKGMIFTETEILPASSAISKFMAIHGLEFDSDDANYKALYRELLSGNESQKTIAITRIENDSILR